MTGRRPTPFRKRKFEPVVIVTCVRWYLQFCLSRCDVEELILERGLSFDHTTIWRRWTQRYGPEVYRRLRGELKRKSSIVRMLTALSMADDGAFTTQGTPPWYQI
jgi:transposase-like protein